MRLMSILRIGLLVCPLLLSGAPVAQAQYGYAPPPPYPQQQPQRRSTRGYPPGYYPGMLVQPAPQPGFSLRRLFGVQDQPQALVPARPVVRPRRPPPQRATIVRQEKPKADPTTQVLVFGDAMAEFAGQGLADLFAETEDVAVIRRAKEDAGLVAMDSGEWGKAIDSALGSSKKTNVAVVMLGTQDRQTLKRDNDSLEAFSDPWRIAYRGRVDAVMRAFRERNLPVVWIGLPPAKNPKVSEDYLSLNEIYRESVERNGGTYVDVWAGFADDENRYAVTGPDVDGQPAKLRTNDGAFFTKAGSRKIAHFADTDIKRLIETGQPAPAVVSVPPADAAPGEPGSLEAALPVLPDEVAPVSLPTKPLIGPVLPLNQAVVTPGGSLVASPPKLSGDQAYAVRRALRDGIAPVARPGRADDFRWPPSE
ncbi:SGNH/GDSL hydrolase family protein [Microvirga antarctica]|uniref:SGNH/GDSL hydrolase family protein n=1 Tax=Microvirga antarctica TaxID=2819233 RepID=UPI001B312614|nr:GDSL-type esterase/lipase family protein [Microvirga antarctica]